MNRYEKECLALLNDMIMDRPKNLNGQVVLYDDRTRNIYLNMLKEQYSNSQKEKALSPESHELLNRLYGLMNEILIRKLI